MLGESFSFSARNISGGTKKLSTCAILECYTCEDSTLIEATNSLCLVSAEQKDRACKGLMHCGLIIELTVVARREMR